MKQMKFFTNQADILQATQCELAQRGISERQQHVFVRDNVQHRYDGLIMQSELECDSYQEQRALTLYAVVVLLGAVALFGQWLDFYSLALLLGLFSLLSLCSKRVMKVQCIRGGALKKVYFLVVDVDEREVSKVENIAKSRPGLLIQ